MAITRRISTTNKALVAPINYVYGETAVSIVFTLSDFNIPTGATAAVYASVPGGSVYTQTATISGNDITISPVSGLFQPGKNAVQVEISIGNKKLITFAVTVNCENQLSENGSASASSVRTSAQIDADVSQIKEDILALQQAGSSSGSGSGSSGSTSGTGWTSSQITLLETVLQNLAYSSASAGQTAAASLISSLRGNSGGSSDSGGSSSGGTDSGNTGTGGNSGSTDTPTIPTLSSISVSYSGGSVDAGTATADLDITVTATFSDSSTQAVTSGYTLYPTTVAEGSNTIYVTYNNKSAEFSVSGNAVSTAECYTKVGTVTASASASTYGTLTIPTSLIEAGKVYVYVLASTYSPDAYNRINKFGVVGLYPNGYAMFCGPLYNSSDVLCNGANVVVEDAITISGISTSKFYDTDYDIYEISVPDTQTETGFIDYVSDVDSVADADSYTGTVTIPVDSVDAGYYFAVLTDSNSYNLSAASTYGRIPYLFFGIKSASKIKWFNCASTPLGTQTITLTDGSYTVNGVSSIRIYSGLKWSVFGISPSWG